MTEVLETTEEVKVPKRLIVKEAIEAGGATKESLMEAAECSSASLATNFTYLRLMGFYPVKDEAGIYSFVTEEEWETLQAERKAKAKTRKTAAPKTPAEILAAAEKRFARCSKALESAKTKAEQFDTEITSLRLTIATAEHRLAEITLEDAKINMPEVDEPIDNEPIDNEPIDNEPIDNEPIDDNLV